MKKIKGFVQVAGVHLCVSIATLAALGFAVGGHILAAGQPAFRSAADAAETLFRAVQNNDEPAIANTLGGASELTTSTDAGQDKRERELFVKKYQEMHRLAQEPDGSVTLYIGAENWPFPVPLINENGTWRFDSAVGKMEVLFRRIGENERSAIVACEEFAASEPHYSGTNSALAKLAGDSATADPILLNGYYFRLVAPRNVSDGWKPAFFLIAYPAEYRSSGVMTFIAAKDGIVYEKDLGEKTAQIASTIARFREDST